MASEFPISIDSFPTVLPTTKLRSGPLSHSGVHNLLGDAVTQLQYRVGIVGSTVASSLEYRITALEDGGGGGGGTVTSVGLSSPSQFTITGSPITTSGTLGLAWTASPSGMLLIGTGSSVGTGSLIAGTDMGVTYSASGLTISQNWASRAALKVFGTESSSGVPSFISLTRSHLPTFTASGNVVIGGTENQIIIYSSGGSGGTALSVTEQSSGTPTIASNISTIRVGEGDAYQVTPGTVHLFTGTFAAKIAVGENLVYNDYQGNNYFTSPAENPLIFPTAANDYTFTHPGFDALIAGKKYRFDETEITVITPWVTGGTDYTVGRVVSYGGYFYECLQSSGSASNAPTGSNSSNTWWGTRGTEVNFLIYAKEGNTSLLHRIKETIETIPDDDEIHMMQAFVSSVAYPSSGIYAARDQHTHNRGGVRGPILYFERLLGSVVSNFSCTLTGVTSLGSTSFNGLIFNAPLTETDQFEPYFSALAPMGLIEDWPFLIKGHLDRLTALFYSSTGGSSTNHWYGMTEAYNADYLRFPYRITFNKVLAQTPTSATVVKADSHDATAAFYALLAHSFVVKSQVSGVAWMSSNYESVYEALFRNVVKRRRGILHSVAYAAANGGYGKPVTNWASGTAYVVGDTVWQWDVTYSGTAVASCIANHTAAAINSPGVGASSATYWNTSIGAGGYLTETFQAALEYPFGQFLDALECYIGYKRTWQLWKLSAWATSTAYVIDQVVSYQGGFYECISAHTSSSSDIPGHSTGWRTYWRYRGRSLYPAQTLELMGFTTPTITGMVDKANYLYNWCPPSFLREGLRIMWKWHAADANSNSEVNWNSVRYDYGDGIAETNELQYWYPDFLSFPFLVIWGDDFRLWDDDKLNREWVQDGMKWAAKKAPNFWKNRNYDLFPPSAWAAAFAKWGYRDLAEECLSFIQEHWASPDTSTMLNHDSFWCYAAERFLQGGWTV